MEILKWSPLCRFNCNNKRGLHGNSAAPYADWYIPCHLMVIKMSEAVHFVGCNQTRINHCVSLQKIINNVKWKTNLQSCWKEEIL